LLGGKRGKASEKGEDEGAQKKGILLEGKENPVEGKRGVLVLEF